MKQTAVEWLAEHLCNEMNFDYWKAVEQAKKMEKEQIKDAFVNGFCNANDIEDKSLNADTIFYNTRYGGKK